MATQSLITWAHRCEVCGVCEQQRCWNLVYSHAGNCLESLSVGDTFNHAHSGLYRFSIQNMAHFSPQNRNSMGPCRMVYTAVGSIGPLQQTLHQRRFCTACVLGMKTPIPMHRFRWNLDATLQRSHRMMLVTTRQRFQVSLPRRTHYVYGIV